MDNAKGINLLDSNHVRLPAWLDDILFNRYGAVYERCPEEVKRTPDSVGFDKIYLGTYFPRSFAEAYYIMGRLLRNGYYLDALKNEEELNVLDFCCGTGGEIIGVLAIFQEMLPNLKRINIDAFDANEEYIFNLNHIIDEIKPYFSIEISNHLECIFVENEHHLDAVAACTQKLYHLILSFKALNELIQANTFPNENIYYKIAKKYLPLLAENGIMLLSDLTHRNNEGGFYYPEKLNEGINSLVRECEGYKSIFPYSCPFYERTCKGCYMQDIVYVTHSRQIRDVSKIAYRVIGKTLFADRILADIQPAPCRAIQQYADKRTPYLI